MLAITWLGHATTLIEIDGVRLLTDPVLRRRIGPLVRIAPAVAASDAGRIDGVVLSHLHADHTDIASLRAVAGGDVPIVAPDPAAAWLRRRGLRRARDLRRGETTTFDGVRVRAVPALHDSHRVPFGPVADAIGYVVAGSRSVYFAGDTDLFDEMAELKEIDVALLPVAGWGRTLGPGHLNPERAARAAALIGPRVAIPIHWGTLALGWPARRPADPQAPAREFAALTKQTAPSVTVRILAAGERTEL